MTRVEIDGQWYDADPLVIETLYEFYNKYHQKKKELERVYGAINDLQVKEHTAAQKNTRAFRMEAWRAKQQLFAVVPHKQVKQQELFG